MSVQTESPCIECYNMVQCKKMCYKRLEWAIFEASQDDAELSIYGNNINANSRKNIETTEVAKLLKDFNKFYKQVVMEK